MSTLRNVRFGLCKNVINLKIISQLDFPHFVWEDCGGVGGGIGEGRTWSARGEADEFLGARELEKQNYFFGEKHSLDLRHKSLFTV